MNAESFSGILNHGNSTNISFQGGSNNRYVAAEIHLATNSHNFLVDSEISEYFGDLKRSTELLYSKHGSHESGFNLALEGTRPTPIQSEELVGPGADYVKSPKRILLVGESEKDKTDLCMMLASDWANGKKCNSSSQYELVIYFNFGELKPRDDVESAIVKRCRVNASETNDETLSLRALKHYSDNILLLLDGFEKLMASQRNQVLNIIRYNSDQPSLFKKATILMASTSMYLTLEKDTLKLFQRQVRLLGRCGVSGSSAMSAFASKPTRSWSTRIANQHDSLLASTLQELANKKRSVQDDARSYFGQFERQ